MHMKAAYATWHFSIILISLRVEEVQVSDFVVHAKILPLGKAFFNLILPHSTLSKKNKSLIFLCLTSHGLFRSTSIFKTSWGTLYFECFLANVIAV